MPRPRALVFVDADVVVRHFLDSGAFTAMARTYDLTLVFPPADWSRLVNTVETMQWNIPYRRIAIPSRRRMLFKKLFFIDQARFRSDREWREIRLGWLTMIGSKAALQFSALALPLFRQMANAWIRWQLKKAPATELNSLVDEEKPSLLIHPSTFEGYFVNDLINVAQERGIPMMLLMNSWDNPSLKRSAIGQPDAVVVWGEQTRRHTEKFMGVAQDRIHVLGSAQFQIFRDPVRRSRAEVCAANGINPSQRVLLYAGSSKGNRELLHLRWLGEAIRAGSLNGTAVLYRPHPYGISPEDARDILAGTIPHVVIEHGMRDFLATVAEGSNKGFFITPYHDTHDLLSAVDAVISPLSTILIEAGLHGKPTLCFIPAEEDEGSHWGVLRDLVHFRDLIDNPVVGIAKSHAEFLPAVESLLARVGDVQDERTVREGMRFFVEFPEQRYADAIHALADRLILKKNAA